MNCALHYDLSAVTLCDVCRNGMCYKCKRIAYYWNSRPVCNKCYREYLNMKLQELKKDKRKSIIILCTLGMAGAPFWTLLFMKDPPEERMRKAIKRGIRQGFGNEKKDLEDDPIANGCITLLITILFFTVISVILFLIHLIKIFSYSVKQDKIQKEIQELNKRDKELKRQTSYFFIEY